MITPLRVLLAGLAILLFLTGFTSVAWSAAGYQDIDAVGVKRLMDEGDPLVVFPLSPIEYDDLHIAGSVNIPMEELATSLPADKNRPVVFYCLGIKCVASWRAAEKAVAMGHQNVYAFRGGLPAWTSAGYPTQSGAKLPEVPIETISTETLSKLLARDEVVLLDINLLEDVRTFHIDHPRRVHIPLNDLKRQTSTLPRDQKIAILCLKGKRSPTAYRYLSGQGFDDLVVVEGGVQRWILEGRKVKKVE